jgi:hypothetical protein
MCPDKKREPMPLTSGHPMSSHLGRKTLSIARNHRREEGGGEGHGEGRGRERETESEGGKEGGREGGYVESDRRGSPCHVDEDAS